MNAITEEQKKCFVDQASSPKNESTTRATAVTISIDPDFFSGPDEATACVSGYILYNPSRMACFNKLQAD